VTIDGESSSVTLRGIDGNATIASSFKEVNVSNIGGTLDIRSQSAKVFAADIKKNATIVTSFNAIEVRRVGGALKIGGESSSVLAEDIGGDIDITNSFKNVILKRTSGSIRIKGDSSAVEVSEIKGLPEVGLIDIRTSFKPIQISFPKDADVRLTARTEFGKIRSDFPVYLQETGDMKGRAVTLEVGKGTTIVRLETSSDISIKGDKISIIKK
jgi:ethanolamine utilization microcompartment shell protein EutS